MRIKARGVCRGNGKVFVRFEVEGVAREHTLSVNFDGDRFHDAPCAIYESYTPAGTTARVFIGVFPILRTGHCAYLIYETNDSQQKFASARFKLNHKKAKWQSRVNYRIDKKLCEAIRDFDLTRAYDQAVIEYCECIEDGAEIILRGIIYTPYREDSDLSMSCITESFEQIPVDLIVMGSSKVPVEFSNEKFRLETQFSIRLPNREQRCFFTISDATHPSFTNFESLNPETIRDLKKETLHIMRNAQIDPNYSNWFDENKADAGTISKQAGIPFEHGPLFSIVVPLFNTPLDFFSEMVASVIAQSYQAWELVLVNASPENEMLSARIKELSDADSRIRSIQLAGNQGISENTNAGVAEARGSFICFFDHDDVMEPNLLFSYAEAISQKTDIDVLYCDEDKLLPDGSYAEPYFKPDFNIDLLRSNNYICHLLAVRSSLMSSLEPNTAEYDGAQDHNLVLKAAEKARHVHHVPQVLYHWRMSASSTASDPNSKPLASQAGLNAVADHLSRLHIPATVSLGKRPFTYEVIYAVPDCHPLVSIIIPTKDHVDILKTCIDSIINKSTYSSYEIIIVENNSVETETFQYYKQLELQHPAIVKITAYDGEFNFSSIINFGAAQANGDYLLLLNNDIEVITPRWIDIMLGICSRDDVGVVGAKLYYRDDTIQHAGICVKGIVAGHLGRNLPKDSCGYFALLDSQQDLSAVTAACMMTKKNVFDAVGGFTEELQIAFNDVDYCLKIRDLNQLVVFTPFVELYHYESLSRGQENTIDKKIRFHKEIAYMNYRWANYYVEGDPYQNRNLSSAEPLNCYYHL